MAFDLSLSLQKSSQLTSVVFAASCQWQVHWLLISNIFFNNKNSFRLRESVASDIEFARVTYIHTSGTRTAAPMDAAEPSSNAESELVSTRILYMLMYYIL